jgi:hypothetical protein
VTPGVKVFLDDERIKIKNFEEYCNLYLKSVGSQSETGEAPKSVSYTHTHTHTHIYVCIMCACVYLCICLLRCFVPRR